MNDVAPRRSYLAARRSMHTGVYATVLLACGAAPAPPLTPDDFTLAGIPANADSTEIRLTFGAPDSVATSENPFDATPLTAWLYDGFEVRFAGRSTPSGFMIHTPGERTARGIGVGDPAELVLRLYGEPAAQSASSWTYVARDSDGGADVNVIDVVVRQDTVRRIYIGWASS